MREWNVIWEAKVQQRDYEHEIEKRGSMLFRRGCKRIREKPNHWQSESMANRQMRCILYAKYVNTMLRNVNNILLNLVIICFKTEALLSINYNSLSKVWISVEVQSKTE